MDRRRVDRLAEWFYDHLVRRLTSAERERLWQESIQFAELFGMPRSAAPASHGAYRRWYEEQLAGEDVYLSPQARYTGRVCAFAIPMPTSRLAGKGLHDLIMLGSLPSRVRELYGLPWSAAHAAGFWCARASMRPTRTLLPGSMLRGSCLREYQLVAQTERRRLLRGQRTPQLIT